MKPLTRSELLGRLVAEGYLSDEHVDGAITHLGTAHSMNAQPWFIKALQGVGGWVASLVLLTGTLLLMSSDQRGALVIGVIMLVAGTLVERRQVESAFVGQVCLSAIMVGAGLMVWGLFPSLGGWTPAIAVTALTCVLLCALVRGWITRCISALGAALCVAVLSVTQTDSMVPMSVFLSVCAGILVKFMICEQSVRSRLKGFYGPLRAALTLFLMGGIAAGTAMRTTSVSHDWLEVWILSAALACMIIISLRHVLIDTGHDPTSQGALTLFAIAFVISLCLAAAPGALAAILLLTLSIRAGDRWTVGLSVIALLGFGANFYYLLEFSLLFKSLLLVVAGGLMVYAGSRLQAESTP